MFRQRGARIIWGFLTLKSSYYLALFNKLIPPKPVRLYFVMWERINLLGNYLIYQSRKHLNRLTAEGDPREEYEWFVKERWQTLKRIHVLSREEWKQYPDSHYLYGFPYQTLGILNLFGGRSSEERFEEYGLRNYLHKEDYILDLGCNCGFMSILASYRSGCKALAVDLNSYAINIGKECLKFLRLEDRVTLLARDLKKLPPEYRKKFTAVFAFAAQWTADGKNRIVLLDYLKYLASFVEKEGRIFFESHCADMENQEFLKTIESLKNHNDMLEIKEFKKIQHNTRYFIVFQKIS